MQLPETIRTAIEELLEGASTQVLERDYQSISDRYRREADAVSLQIKSSSEALAYAAVRLPATYGSVSSACGHLRSALRDFSPQTLLDLGAGPGTATLAAFHIWSDTLEEALLIEPNAHLRSIAERLLQTVSIKATQQASALSAAKLGPAYDLVMASYVLNEIAAIDLEAELTRLWQITKGALILIEPGTPLGFDIVQRARSILLDLGAHLAAPCPHSLACPLAHTQRWCHFSTRIDRSSLHRKIKGQATLGYEDEKFSYITAARLPSSLPQARLLGHPHRSKLIDLELCQADGTAAVRRLSKRDAEYKQARKLKWGDGL